MSDRQADLGPTSWRGRGLALLLAVMLTGCSTGPWPGQTLVGYPGLAAQIRDYYDRWAWERQGTCVQPRMNAILRAAIVEESEHEATVLVRYAWRDEVSDDDPFMIGCNSIDERRFVIDTRDVPPRVLSMDGGQRRPRGN